jgi:hypothetical protein
MRTSISSIQSRFIAFAFTLIALAVTTSVRAADPAQCNVNHFQTVAPPGERTRFVGAATVYPIFWGNNVASETQRNIVTR